MNLFVLSHDPILAAHMNCDLHVRKIIVEAFQMLGSALHRYNIDIELLPLTSKGTPLKGGYHHHPVTKWVGESRSNYIWCIKHALELGNEYQRRFNKIHACHSKIFSMVPLASWIPEGRLTQFVQAFGKENEGLKCDDPVLGYQNYYNFVKRHSIKMSWTNRAVPFFYKNFAAVV